MKNFQLQKFLKKRNNFALHHFNKTGKFHKQIASRVDHSLKAAVFLHVCNKACCKRWYTHWHWLIEFLCCCYYTCIYKPIIVPKYLYVVDAYAEGEQKFVDCCKCLLRVDFSLL